MKNRFILAFLFVALLIPVSGHAILVNESTTQIVVLDVQNDTYIDEGNSDTNFASVGNGINTGIDIGNSGGSNEAKGLVKFNYSESDINEDFINSLTLTVRTQNGGAKFDDLLWILPVIQPAIIEQATWNKYDSSNFWGTAGADLNGTDREALIDTFDFNGESSLDVLLTNTGLAGLNKETNEFIYLVESPDGDTESGARTPYGSEEGGFGWDLTINYTDYQIALVSPINNATLPIRDLSDGTDFFTLTFEARPDQDGYVQIVLDGSVVETYAVESSNPEEIDHNHFFDTYGNVSIGNHNWTAILYNSTGGEVERISTEFNLIDGEDSLFLTYPNNITIEPSNSSGYQTIQFSFKYTTGNEPYVAFLFIDGVPFSDNPISLVTSYTQNLTKSVTYNLSKHGFLVNGNHSWEIDLAKCDTVPCSTSITFTGIDRDSSSFTLEGASVGSGGNNILNPISPINNNLVVPEVVFSNASGNFTGMFFTWGYKNVTFSSRVELWVNNKFVDEVNQTTTGDFNLGFTYPFITYGNLSGSNTWYLKLYDRTIVGQEALRYVTPVETFRISQSSSSLVTQADLIPISPIGSVEPVTDNQTLEQYLDFKFRYTANAPVTFNVKVFNLNDDGSTGSLAYGTSLSTYPADTNALVTHRLNFNETGGLPNGDYEFLVEMYDTALVFVQAESTEFTLTESQATGIVKSSQPQSDSLVQRAQAGINKILGFGSRDIAGLWVLSFILTIMLTAMIGVKTKELGVSLAVFVGCLLLFSFIGWFPKTIAIVVFVIAGGLVTMGMSKVFGK